MPGDRQARTALLGIAVIYCVLGVFYSVTNPLFEAPDEQWHFLYSRYIASGAGLPVLDHDDSLNVAGVEGAQAPLYYLVGGVLTSWVPRQDLYRYIEPNPAGSRGYPDSLGNKNVWVQLRTDRFPWEGEYLAAHLLRFLSICFGVVTILATFLTARELLPYRPLVWVSAAAFNAFIPQFLFITAAVTNDSAAAAAGGGILRSSGAATPDRAR